MMCSTQGDQLEGSGMMFLLVGDGNAVVIIARYVVKAQVLYPKCGK
jgi:hypothetical protein